MGAGIAQLGCLGGFEVVLHDPDPQALASGADRLAGRAREGRRQGALEPRRTLPGRRRARDRDLRRARRLRPGDRGGARGPRAEARALRPSSRRRAAPRRSSPRTPRRSPSPRSPRECRSPSGSAACTSSTRRRSCAWSRSSRESTPPRRRSTPQPRSRARWTASRSAPPTRPASSSTAATGRSRSSRFACWASASPPTPRSTRRCAIVGGYRMGPFELMDLIGVDVNLKVAQSFYAQREVPRWEPHEIQEEMVAEGRLGPQGRTRLLRVRGRAQGRGARAAPAARRPTAPSSSAS